MRKYNDCYYCGGKVQEKLIDREIRWQGNLFILEDVPDGICVQCGEGILKPDVVKEIDRILQGEGMPSKTVKVPVYQYKQKVA